MMCDVRSQTDEDLRDPQACREWVMVKHAVTTRLLKVIQSRIPALAGL